MTAKEKTILARFFDLSGASLRGGYRAGEPAYDFGDDPEGDETSLHSGGADRAKIPAVVQAGTPAEIPAETPGAGVIEEARRCRACPLGETRINAVPGEGAARPLVMVIGEGPGAEEDATGRPFVGPAGRLLDRMLESAGLSRNRNCFIGNTVKCRPPMNRDPLPNEIITCAPFLTRQLVELKPLVILCVGKVAANRLLHGPGGEIEPIGRLRGNFREYEIEDKDQLSLYGGNAARRVPLLATYHPSALLRDDSLKKPAFEDLKLLMAKLAGLDEGYRAEVMPLMKKYAAADKIFAAAVGEYLS